jgi:hypothetical protein
MRARLVSRAVCAEALSSREKKRKLDGTEKDVSEEEEQKNHNRVATINGKWVEWLDGWMVGGGAKG